MSGVLASTPALQAVALLTVGVLAGYINVVAGGGSLLSVPLLIFLGLPETVANGTSRLAILTQSITAVTAFHRAGRIDRALLARFTAPALLGAALGAFVATQLEDDSFRGIFGWVMLGCAAFVVVNPQLTSSNDIAPTLRGGATLRAEGTTASGIAPALRGGAMSMPRRSPAWVWPTLFVIGMYGGAVQAGVGYLVLAGLVLLLRVDLLQANVLKVVLVGMYTPLALAIFVWQGQVDLWLGFLLAVGQALGGWLGAAATLKRGERFLRLMLALVVVASGLKLLLD